MIKYVILVLLSLFTISCANTPKRVILFSENPEEITKETNILVLAWEELKARAALTTDKRLKWTSKSKMFQIEVGKVRTIQDKNAVVAEKSVVDFQKKRWGVKVIYWFKEKILI